MNNFNENLGKEVLMLVEEKKSTSTVFFFKKPEEILSCFNRSVLGNINDINLYHGVLTKATSIPAKISNNIDIIVIVRNKNINVCNILPCINISYAQNLISLLVGSKTSNKDMYYDSIIADISKIPKQDIDNIYILYGYTIELHYTFDKNELDEEIITGSKEVYDSICSAQ